MKRTSSRRPTAAAVLALTVASATLAALAGRPAAAEPLYVSIKGPALPGTAPHQNGLIPALAFTQSISNPSGNAAAGSGAGGGHATLSPFLVTMAWCPALPAIEKAAIAGQRLQEVTLTFVQTDSHGAETPYLTMRLTNVQVSGVSTQYAAPGTPGASDPPATVDVQFDAEAVQVLDGASGSSSSGNTTTNRPETAAPSAASSGGIGKGAAVAAAPIRVRPITAAPIVAAPIKPIGAAPAAAAAAGSPAGGGTSLAAWLARPGNRLPVIARGLRSAIAPRILLAAPGGGAQGDASSGGWPASLPPLNVSLLRLQCGSNSSDPTIDVKSFTASVNRPAAMGYGSGGGAAKASFSAIAFTKALADQQAYFQQAALQGTHLPVLIFTWYSPSNQPVYKVKLENVLVSSLAQSVNASSSLAQVKLTFEKITITSQANAITSPANAGAVQTFGWNIAQNKAL